MSKACLGNDVGDSLDCWLDIDCSSDSCSSSKGVLSLLEEVVSQSDTAMCVIYSELKILISYQS